MRRCRLACPVWPDEAGLAIGAKRAFIKGRNTMSLFPPCIVNGRAVIPADPLHIFAYASFIRHAEEEALRLYHEGHVAGTIHTCLGQELCQMAVVRALLPQDYVLSNHRNHGHLLSYGGDAAGFFAELTGRQGALCGGRGGSQHMAAGRFHSNGVQGGMTAIAAGLALAERFAAGDGIVAVMIGDGTLGEGLVYESMNLAALWNLPVLFVVENNGIAQTTPTDRGVAGNMLARGQAFGLASHWLADTDPGLMQKAAEVVTEVRVTRKPAYLVIETARLGPHSKGDDLRPEAEIARVEARDPLLALKARLPEKLAAAAGQEALAFVRECSAEVLSRPLAEAEPRPAAKFRAPGLPSIRPGITARECLNRALQRLLENDPLTLLLGEDLHDPYGGAFKVTAGLSTAYPGRVLSTPISEGAIAGTAIGLALAGLRPVAEIMFADFLSLCADQLYNHAAKLSAIKGANPVSMVIRTASGGRRGYGPTHSQSPEALFASIPGLTVIAPNHRTDPGCLLERAVTAPVGPALFFEHKLLYGRTVEQGAYRPLPACLPNGLDALFPTMAKLEDAPDLIVLAYGGMLAEAEAAAQRLAEEEELTIEILAPTLLSPFPAAAIAARVRRCPRLLIAEEGPKAFGIGAEIAAALAEAGVRASIGRVASEAVIIPAARHLEREALPDASTIFSAALSLFEGHE